MIISADYYKALQRLQGLLVVFILTFLSSLIIKLPFLANAGISPLVLAIILGIGVGNIVKLPHSFAPGIQFAAKRLLRIAVVLYGFNVSFQEIASVGIHALLIDIIVVASTLLVGFYLGRKYFKIDYHLALLISAGAAICGAAAVLAIEEVIKSEPHKTTIAIATVVLFGTLSMFLYPLMQNAGLFGFSEAQFGLFAGASIHEVAQALVAGSNVSSNAGNIAVIVKMMRVLLLVPVLFIIAYLTSRYTTAKKRKRIIVPWFALGFVAVIAFNSLHLLSQSTVKSINQFDLILLTMAMGAIGLETKLAKMKQVGIKPFYLAVTLFAWLLTSVYLMVSMS
jgi:uncharacterized integral membrane protein (TIGR00698 family)